MTDLGSIHREHFGGDKLAVAAPGKGAHVTFPSEFHMFSGASHQFVGHSLVCHREFEFIGAQIGGGVAVGLEAGLYHLALVGLEDDAFLLEIVDIPGVDAGAVYEKEVEININRHCYDGYRGAYSDDFCFACKCHVVSF